MITKSGHKLNYSIIQASDCTYTLQLSIDNTNIFTYTGIKSYISALKMVSSLQLTINN